MNILFILDYWLDTIAAALGVVATFVGIYTAFKLMESDQPTFVADEGTSVPSLAPEERAMAFSVAKPRASTTHPTAIEWRTEGQQAQPNASPRTPAQQSAELLPPRLDVDKVRALGSERLRLTLRNNGGTMIFQDVKVGEFNEMEVAYTPPIYREKESFAQGSALNFTLQCQQMERGTYHFFVAFRDDEGQLYQQEIAGLGTEPPIIEQPFRAK
jgi:hypothetical protein